jgi:hypothetical protein
VAITLVVVDGANAVALGRFAHTIKASGRRFKTAVAMHLTVTDGKINRLHLYEDTLAVAEGFEFQAPARAQSVVPRSS